MPELTPPLPINIDDFVDTAREPLLVLCSDLRVRRANRSFYRCFAIDPEKAEGRLVYEVDDQQWDIPALRRLLEEVLPQQLSVNDFEVIHDFRRFGRKVMLVNARRVHPGDSDTELIMLAIEDVTERRREVGLSELEASSVVKPDEAEATLLAAVVDTVGQAVIATEPCGKIIYWNRFAETLYGWTKAEVLGRNVMEITVPQSQTADAESVMAKLAAGESWSGEFLVQRRDGTMFPALVTNAPIFDERGVLTAIVGISSDITERKQTEEALLRSEQRFRALMEQAPFSIQVFSPDGHTIRVNKAWEELWGLRFEQIAVYNVLEDPQLEAKGILPHIRQGFAGQTTRIPAILYDPNETIPDLTRHEGRRRWISAVIYPLKDSEGEVQEVVLIHEDITARHRSEEALLEAHRQLENRVTQRTAELVEANEFLKALLENVQTGIIACDAAGVITLFNSVTRALHGIPEDPLPPDRWVDEYRLYRPDGETPMGVEDVPLYRALQGERVVNTEMILRPTGLPPRTVVASGQAIYDAEGEKLGAVVSLHDITQRKQAEEALRKIHQELEQRVEERTLELARANEALREADRRKDEFLATLAHELRNPLAPISNSLQLLKMPRVDAEMVRQSRDMMERQVQQLVRLVDDLLDVSRVMRGKIELRREPVELAMVVARAVETAQPLIEIQGHRLELSIPSESLLINADPVRLAQVIGNLLTNSAKYTESNGRIRLSAQREGTEAVLRVQDNGIGIAPDALPHVFELFVQVDHAATRSQGGLGIGLTLVKNLVEMHGGTVEARSDGLDQGCEFVLRLPLVAQQTPEPVEIVEPEQRQPASSGYRLLVVDDNRDAATSLALLLRLQGHEVQVAHDGPTALQVATTYRPNLVFLDIGMPKMDGYEVARQLRQTPGLENTVLAALTGWGQEEDRRRTLEAGFHHHLVKPPESEALQRVLAGLSSS